MSKILPIQRKIRQLADKKRAKISQSFSKTGPGDYAENDKFLGVTAPQIKKIVKTHQSLSLKDLEFLLQSKFHEERLTALRILVEQYKKADSLKKSQIFKIYINNTKHINNWALVDLSAHYIVGAYLEHKSKKLLFSFANSKNLWEKRIAMIATFYYIKKNEFKIALQIAEKLIFDKNDLIQKAVGWMLREIGKQSLKTEERFLKKFASVMPRTALRYAIEKMTPERKKYFMNLKSNN